VRAGRYGHAVRRLITPALKRLEALGLPTRSLVPVNERALAVDLIPAGRRLRAKALQVRVTMVKRLGPTREQVDVLDDAMRAITLATGTELSPSSHMQSGQ